MIEWGQKSKPKKIPGPKISPLPHQQKKKNRKKSHAEFPSLKNFQKALNDIRWKIKFWKTSFVVLICRSMWPGYTVTTQIFRLFWISPKLPNWTKPPKRIPAKISYPKEILELKISNPKKPFDHPGHLKSQVPAGELSFVQILCIFCL